MFPFLYILLILTCKFLILSQQDPVDNSTLYWRIILYKYSIIIIIIINDPVLLFQLSCIRLIHLGNMPCGVS